MFEYSSSANPLITDKLRHKRMLLSLSVNIRIFSVPNIEGPPNIMGHSVDSGQSADWWRLLQKSGKSADSTQMHGRNLRGFG